MTRIFGDDGRALAGTILVADPVTVTQVKTKEGKDAYSAIQVGTGIRRAKNISKAVMGHMKNLPKEVLAERKGAGFKAIREFRISKPESETGGSGNSDLALGSIVNVDTFTVGDMVQVTGLTKGKGFAGVVKRHGFHGGPRSHGQKHTERSPGSIGGGGGRAGGRVAKGIKMAGRMGSDRVVVRNLKVLVVDVVAGKMIVSGAVPGRRGTLLEVVSA